MGQNVNKLVLIQWLQLLDTSLYPSRGNEPLRYRMDNFMFRRIADFTPCKLHLSNNIRALWNLVLLECFYCTINMAGFENLIKNEFTPDTQSSLQACTNVPGFFKCSYIRKASASIKCLGWATTNRKLYGMRMILSQWLSNTSNQKCSTEQELLLSVLSHIPHPHPDHD